MSFAATDSKSVPPKQSARPKVTLICARHPETRRKLGRGLVQMDDFVMGDITRAKVDLLKKHPGAIISQRAIW
jgi:hypothetical protein